MKIKDLSITLCTKQIDECKDFYVNVLGGKVTFDSGWYITVCFSDRMNISFITPEKTDSKMESSEVMINFMVEDIDSEYSVIKERVDIVTDIANQPWGDRSFRIADPMGNIVYIYMPAPIADIYKDAIKE